VDWAPVDACALHTDMGDLLGLEPVPQSLKGAGGGGPRAHLLAQRLARLAHEQASHDCVLVDIQPTAALDESSHEPLHIIRRRARRRRYGEDTAMRDSPGRCPACSSDFVRRWVKGG